MPVPFPDIVWAGLAIIGGYLLIGHESRLTLREKLGVILIFIGFLFQVYWEILFPPQPNSFVWNVNSISEISFLTLFLAIATPLFIWPGILSKHLERKKPKNKDAKKLYPK